jgi:hypothetical protein
MEGTPHESTQQGKLIDQVAQRILASPAKCTIVGSYVYKRWISGHEVPDIDCICEDPQLLAHELQEGYEVTLKPAGSFSPFGPGGELSLAIWNNPRSFWRTRQFFNVDIMPTEQYDRKTRHVSSFINNLRLTQDGVVHKHDDTTQMDFIISSLKKQKFCRWSDIRGKDERYFSEMGFTALDEEVCNDHGLFYFNKEK